MSERTTSKSVDRWYYADQRYLVATTCTDQRATVTACHRGANRTRINLTIPEES